MTTVVPVEKKVLSENQRIAEELRQGYAKRGTLCLNIISSPGSGKQHCSKTRWQVSASRTK